MTYTNPNKWSVVLNILLICSTNGIFYEFLKRYQICKLYNKQFNSLFLWVLYYNASSPLLFVFDPLQESFLLI